MSKQNRDFEITGDFKNIMGLIRKKISDLIRIVDEKNVNNFDYPFYGININKEFMPSVANTDNVDRKKYKIICKNRFREPLISRLLQNLFCEKANY